MSGLNRLRIVYEYLDNNKPYAGSSKREGIHAISSYFRVKTATAFARRLQHDSRPETRRHVATLSITGLDVIGLCDVIDMNIERSAFSYLSTLIFARI